MKLFKAIRLHWGLRIRQEYLFDKVVSYSQIRPHPGDISPRFDEFVSVNKAVRNIEKRIPNIYFFLSDLFGGASLLKKRCKEYKNNEDQKWIQNIINNLFVYDLVANPGFSNI